MAGDKTVETTGLLGWIDRRFPLSSLQRAHVRILRAKELQLLVFLLVL